MSSVYDLHLRSASLPAPSPNPPPPRLGAGRAGETTGERRIRLLRTVLGDLRSRPEG
jgi:hypothetical protein